MADDDRFVIYMAKVCRVRMVYSHWLELEIADGSIVQARFGDPELDRYPSAEDLEAVRRPAPAKRKRR